MKVLLRFCDESFIVLKRCVVSDSDEELGLVAAGEPLTHFGYADRPSGVYAGDRRDMLKSRQGFP